MGTIVFEQSGTSVRVAKDLMTLLRNEAASGYERMVWGGVEFGGLLIGELHDGEVLVHQRIPSECEHAYGPAFELSAKDEEHFKKQVEASKQTIVGWYRTTSRDLSLTQTDEALFNKYFPNPEHVTLLIRRARNEEPRFAVIRRSPTGALVVISEFTSDLPLPKVVKVQVQEVTEEPEVQPVRVVKLEDDWDPEPPEPPFEQFALNHSNNGTFVDEAPPDEITEEEPARTTQTVLEVFHLKSAPFSQVADPDFFHAAPTHRAALNKLRAGIEARKGFLLLSGETGVGKSMVMRCLTQQLEKAGIAFSCLLNSRVTVDDLFDWIALDMDLQCATRRKSDVWIALVERLSQRRTALLVDDAHKLSAEVLEEIELLGNLENRSGALLQVVLAGNSMLDDTLDEFRHNSLKQRITVRARLAPLTQDETTAYIATRMKAAGWTGGSLFGGTVVERIWQRTGGIPRLINSLCEAVLETACNEGHRELTGELVDRTD